jgi:hypothetical protein
MLRVLGLPQKRGGQHIRVGKWTGDTSRFPHCQMKFLFLFLYIRSTHTSNNNRKIITLTSVVSFVRFLFFFLSIPLEWNSVVVGEVLSTHKKKEKEDFFGSTLGCYCTI